MSSQKSTEMVVEKTRLGSSELLAIFVCAIAFESILILLDLTSIGLSHELFVLVYFIGLSLAAVSVPMLPYAILTAYREARLKHYAKMVLAVFAVGAAVMTMLGAMLILIFQHAMAGAYDW